jgi:hypothetical protein
MNSDSGSFLSDPHAYTYLVMDDAKQHHIQDILSYSDEYKNRPLNERVVTAEAGKNSTFGKYRLEHTRQAFFARLLAIPVGQRFATTVLTPNQMVLFYADCEFELEKGEDCSEEMQLSLARVLLEFIRGRFAEDYPLLADLMNAHKFWIFTATRATKISLHIHGDPYSRSAVWLHMGELKVFAHAAIAYLKKMHGTDDKYAAVLTRPSTRKNDKGVAVFMDRMVYNNNKTQNINMPLCSKVGGTIMKFLACDSGTADRSDATLLNVGIIVVPLIDASLHVLLPVLAPNKPTLTSIASHVSANKKLKMESVEEEDSQPGISGEEMDSKKTCLLRVLSADGFGDDARFHSFSYKNGDHSIQAIFAARTIVCPIAQRVHKSNRVTISGRCTHHSASLFIACFSAGCLGKQHRVNFSEENCLHLFSRKVGDISIPSIAAAHTPTTEAILPSSANSALQNDTHMLNTWTNPTMKTVQVQTCKALVFKPKQEPRSAKYTKAVEQSKKKNEQTGKDNLLHRKRKRESSNKLSAQLMTDCLRS